MCVPLSSQIMINCFRKVSNAYNRRSSMDNGYKCELEVVGQL